MLDRSSAPHASQSQLDARVVDLIERLRRAHKWTARQIHLELTHTGHRVSLVTVARWLVRLGINRRRDIDPDGSTNRRAGRITARYPGHMVHLDVKKVGRIPDGKVEHDNRILAEELLYALIWACEAERAASITIWNIHYNYHRAHTASATDPRPHASKPASPTS